MLARQGPGGSAVSAMWRALAIAAAYFVADTLLNKFALGDGWEIFWPLNGVTIALLIRRPRREWPQLLTAVALGTGGGGEEFAVLLPDTPLEGCATWRRSFATRFSNWQSLTRASPDSCM